MGNKSEVNPSKLISFIKDKKKRIVNFLGTKIIIHKNVFPVVSLFSFSSEITARRIPENAGAVLDVGTGTGVQAIISAKKGAKKVIAIDIDENSLENAKENVVFHKLEKIIEVRKSDLFENIKKEEMFDLIISQLPFADKKFKGEFKHLLFDEGYKLHERLLKESRFHLSKEGVILIAGGEIGNERKLLQLIKKYSYFLEDTYQEEYNGLIWKIYKVKSIA
jgi:methylase of polypeptide subunit release factors